MPLNNNNKKKTTPQENEILQPQPDTISLTNPIRLLVHFVLVEKMQKYIFRKNS